MSAPSMSSPDVTLVVPVLNEEAVLPELLARLTRLFDANAGVTWSVLLVNDGSRDHSAKLVRERAEADFR